MLSPVLQLALGAINVQYQLGTKAVSAEVQTIMLWFLAPWGAMALLAAAWGVIGEPWRRERRIIAENREMARRLSQRQKDGDIALALAKLHRDGMNLYIEGIADAASFESWTTRREAWETEMIQGVALFISPIQASLITYCVVRIQNHDYKFNDEHNIQLNYLGDRLIRLRQHIDQYERKAQGISEPRQPALPTLENG